jgi:lysozyme family protein
MSIKQDVIKYSTGVEAGYVNDPDDLGGETNHGITKKTAEEYKYLWSKYGWDGNMKTMPIDLAYEIYSIGWWDKLYLDKVSLLSENLAYEMFDFGINAGRTNCVTELQRILNVTNKLGTLYPDLVVDGVMGNNTLKAINIYVKKTDKGSEKLAALLWGMRVTYYVRISESRDKNEKFTNGWFNRSWNNLIRMMKSI